MALLHTFQTGSKELKCIRINQNQFDVTGVACSTIEPKLVEQVPTIT